MFAQPSNSMTAQSSLVRGEEQCSTRMNPIALNFHSKRAVIFVSLQEEPSGLVSLRHACHDVPQTLVIALTAAVLLLLCVASLSAAFGPFPLSGFRIDQHSGQTNKAVGSVVGAWDIWDRLQQVARGGVGMGMMGGSGRQEEDDASWGRLEGGYSWMEGTAGRMRRKKTKRRAWREGGAAREWKRHSDGLPSFAFCIAGSNDGHGARMARLLSAVYHPRNAYCLHMDAAAREEEMEVIRRRVREDPVIRATGNVFVMEKRNLVTYRGVTMTAMFLHCAAILLERRQYWDWFINLSATSYPLVTPDDLIHAFSSVPRHLSFISHERFNKKWMRRAERILIDEAIATRRKRLTYTGKKRSTRTFFQNYKGELWVILARPFVQFLLDGVDPFPRTLLLYMANFDISDESYFHTAACNSNFSSTIVNTNTHFILRPSRKWKIPHPVDLEEIHIPQMTGSKMAFARKFANVSVLNLIDRTILGLEGRRYPEQSGWCKATLKSPGNCTKVGNLSRLIPGSGGIQFLSFVEELIEPDRMRRTQCT